MNGKNNESSSRFFDADDTLNSKLSSSNQQPTAVIAGLLIDSGHRRLNWPFPPPPGQPVRARALGLKRRQHPLGACTVAWSTKRRGRAGLARLTESGRNG